MPFTLHPLLPPDIPRSTDIYFAAFQNPHSLACWPRNVPAVRTWWGTMILTELHEPGSQWLKAVSDDDTGEVAGFCKWRRFGEGEEVGTGLPEWPEGADARLCAETFGGWVGRHPGLMGGRAHWYLEILATDPKYQGQGAGSQLMRWGLERADQEGVEAYLEASPDAVRLYEHFGFREAARTDTWIENERVKPGVMYRNLFMIRPSKGAG
ncbi:hypothetical protein LTR57_000162 [Friedmanniomyces endolithicus]|uniref:N-acetyltransferase domain-containing protein n=1 Tax=Friedmanniomyces endolithicus TaxID=329885 RepID=A0A4U0TXU2_9PEZI|nr:hypothetical protein LTS09_001343 [Friedmanniomyces endolithicus]KAK0291880.1 hypothetical protein LTR35_001308 [Friedmanniomyces endolithicus]KAK0931943.1 hypothetical protein LTR57_000162 [Friedmanniomyces endolithicus]KAK1018549.1 hypothetical protein LTR54_001436 [Friedmanniomyces endolithicus]TKA27248.1 hypothetical protein B0A54_16143 [Friedmanniomyces endolithicus]